MALISAQAGLLLGLNRQNSVPSVLFLASYQQLRPGLNQIMTAIELKKDTG